MNNFDDLGSTPSPLGRKKGISIFELGKDFLLLLGFFLVGVFITQSIIGCFGGQECLPLMAQAGTQSILAFLIPGLAVIYLSYGNKGFVKIVGNRPNFLKIFLAFGLALIGMAALNQIIYWNENLSLPDCLKGIEQSWRKAEELNGEFTSKLTSGTDFWSLLVGLLIVGLLTGMSEEFFFRGAMMGVFIRGGIPRQWSLWITAVIFSLMHFQMFGFVPRMLLGAWFGYLYLWSGNIWLAVAAHAFNNSLVVLTLWLVHNGYISENIDSFGVSSEGVPWMAALSCLTFALLLIPARKYFIRSCFV